MRRCSSNSSIDCAQQTISNFATRLLAEWNRLALPLTDERLIVAVSGGADSLALLLACDELVRTARFALQVTVAHLDHELQGERSASDAQWVAALARDLGYDIAVSRVAVKQRATESADNLEQAARRTRYEFLGQTAISKEACAVLTAHTMDDQAETVLLRMLRGSGSDGLGGIEPVRSLLTSPPPPPQREVLLVRPLVQWAQRADTEEYCRMSRVEFRVDEMNRDESFARVRVRQRLLPLMKTFNPRIVEALVRTANLLRADSAVLTAQAAELLKAAGDAGHLETLETISCKAAPASTQLTDRATITAAMPLSVTVLASASVALRRRALRQWIASEQGTLRRIELVHLIAVERLLKSGRGGRIAELPGGTAVVRYGGQLYLRACKVEKGTAAI